MSFSMNFIGDKNAVIKAIEQYVGHGDTSQVDVLKEYICSEIEAFPPSEYNNGILVEASGHHDSSNRYLKLEIKMVNVLPPSTE